MFFHIFYFFLSKNFRFLLISFFIVCLSFEVLQMMPMPSTLSEDTLTIFIWRLACLNILVKLCYFYTIFSFILPFSFWIYVSCFGLVKAKDSIGIRSDISIFLIWFTFTLFM